MSHRIFSEISLAMQQPSSNDVVEKVSFSRMRLFLFDWVKIPLKRIHSRLIIVMDNDTAGKKAAEKLAVFCKEHDTPFIMAQNDVYGGFKDANDLLLHDRETLVKTLKTLSERTENLDIEK